MAETSVSTPASEAVRWHSFSSLNGLINICALQWRYRYLDKVSPERKASALGFGAAVNDGLVSLDRDLYAGTSPNLTSSLDLFHERWKGECADSQVPIEFGDGESFETLDEKGRSMISHYLSELSPDEKPWNPDKRRFTVPLQGTDGRLLNRPLTGEFDRVIELNGKIGIVDWKTAAKRWTANDLLRDLQSTVYSYAFQLETGRAAEFFRYDLLLKTKSPSIERYYVDRTEHDVRRFLRLVLEADRTIDTGIFPPRDKSWACKGCPYRDRCQSWGDR